ncbi:MAG: hypothetical protein H7145_14500 [Akkermansiaceae bacterium]|nr:hypothetical protein [Armatimonadota bacterium]
MAMPKKGSRSIAVDEMPYRFRISGDNGRGIANLKVAVEAVADGNLTTLVVDTSVLTPIDIWLYINNPEEKKKALETRTVYITTAVVEAYIRQALAKGWKPTEKGKPFALVADAAMATGKT